MFGFGHSGTATSVDTDLERDPPPPATVVYFPQNDIHFNSVDTWITSPPDLYSRYAHIAKPIDVQLPDLASLNLEIRNDVALEDFVPRSSDGLQHLPPKTWDRSGAIQTSKVANSASYEVFAHKSYPLLSNGTRAPEIEVFNRYVTELVSNTDDVLRLIGKRKPRAGHQPPTLSTFRKFWTHLEGVASYWDTSLDHYFDVDIASSKGSSKGFKAKLSSSRRSSVQIDEGSRRSSMDPGSHKHVQRYKGRRTSTGSKMPDHFRNDLLRSLIDPIAQIFGCQLANPRRVPQLQIKKLLVPVTQTAIVWRVPQDKAQTKRGILEGPILGIQCRAETTFVRDTKMAILDAAREIAGVILLAQERAREGKTDVIPGEGKWYTTTPRWGGGPGGEFGDAEGDKDTKPSANIAGRRHSLPTSLPSRMKPSEEQIWKELKPGPGMFESRITYLAVGKDRTAEWDSVFMVSALYHHVSILRLDVHPLYLEYLVSGIVPSQQPNKTWYAPKVRRTRWFDLLVGEDRAEALRGIWGVMSYAMRTGPTSMPLGQRQTSEVSHMFHFRKKHSISQEETAQPPQRSSSLGY